MEMDSPFTIKSIHLNQSFIETGTGFHLKSLIVSPFNLNPECFYLLRNGKIFYDSDKIKTDRGDEEQDVFRILPRLPGGKGGFGSMLRAIGAQIEKTTNRDACRDLSGRRLRDINEEQRLKRWFAKQKERDEEKAALKKKKLEKLKQICEGPPLPKMEDQEYNRQRAEMSDKVSEAVEKGFEKPSSSKSITDSSNSDSDLTSKIPESNKLEDEKVSPSSSIKAKSTKQLLQKSQNKLKRTIMDQDLDSDVSSTDSEDDETPKKKLKS